MSSDALYLVLLGGPGAGKGTQAERLSAALGIPQVSTGDLFRENLKEDTELGLLAKGYMERGELVPDEVTVEMVRVRLSQPDAAKGVILDGFPRTVAQAEALQELMTALGTELAVAPYIKVDEDTLVARLAGQVRSGVRAHVPEHIAAGPVTGDTDLGCFAAELGHRIQDVRRFATIGVRRSRTVAGFAVRSGTGILIGLQTGVHVALESRAHVVVAIEANARVVNVVLCLREPG